uniref:Uncharacterized protein n=1 Tax=Alexandrium catenella TaxID=2925 RepID=A0A7S1WJR1_ALECA|mmetsp:Transcript_67473/g.179643  ORF Transcript_67473/g.179643 Transcript_67473/m.179643 type:complete len:471 (+) Transcript_67473:139-1551(+)
MAPQDDSLSVGDTVVVSDMPEDTGLNGTMGVLLKPVGKGRWALKVDGDEKSKVVPTPNLQKVNVKGSGPPAGGSSSAPAKYSIVGTWDDWEPQEMLWNSRFQHFEFAATIGTDGSESFKILQNGDWDGCVYPDRKDACPHDNHKIHGPDDGGLNEEWTIGVHPSDKATVGARIKIVLHVSKDGKPARVDWGHAQEAEQARMPVEARKPAMPAEEPKYADRAEEQRSRPRQKFTDGLFKPPEAQANINSGGGQERQQAQPASWDQLARQEDVEDVERKARERLMARFAAAAEADPLAIEDEQTSWADEVEDRQRIDRLQQVEMNKQRYRRSVEEATRKPGELSKDEAARQMQNATRFCVECGKMTAAFFGNGVCESCWKVWESLEKKGEPTDVIPSNLPAGLRIYLRMKKSQMKEGPQREGDAEEAEQEVVRERKIRSRRTVERPKKAAAQAQAAKDDDEDEYWDELPLPK